MNDENFGYLYVLEYSYPSIFEIELTEEDQDLSSDEILEKHGLKESVCEFMYTENKLELTTIKN